jgi:hypothetical protein
LIYKKGFVCEDFESDFKKLNEELKKMDGIEGAKYLYSILENSIPDGIHVDIIRKDEQGYIIEVECFPVIYMKITKFKNNNFDDSDIQDAKLDCERFLKTIFVGGLCGTLLSEKEQWNHEENTTILLINDVKMRQITAKIETTLESATAEVLIIAWMGTILLSKLRELKEKGVKIRVITGNVKKIRQDVMQKEKEKAFEELIATIGLDNICTKRDFHGRAIIIDNKRLLVQWT